MMAFAEEHISGGFSGQHSNQVEMLFFLFSFSATLLQSLHHSETLRLKWKTKKPNGHTECGKSSAVLDSCLNSKCVRTFRTGTVWDGHCCECWGCRSAEQWPLWFPNSKSRRRDSPMSCLINDSVMRGLNPEIRRQLHLPPKKYRGKSHKGDI